MDLFLCSHERRWCGVILLDSYDFLWTGDGIELRSGGSAGWVLKQEVFVGCWSAYSCDVWVHVRCLKEALFEWCMGATSIYVCKRCSRVRRWEDWWSAGDVSSRERVNLCEWRESMNELSWVRRLNAETEELCPCSGLSSGNSVWWPAVIGSWSEGSGETWICDDAVRMVMIWWQWWECSLRTWSDMPVCSPERFLIGALSVCYSDGSAGGAMS